MQKREDLSLIERMLSLVNFQENGCGTEMQPDDSAAEIDKFLNEIPGGFLIYRAGGDECILYANKALLKIFACKTFEEFVQLTGNSFKGMIYHEDLEIIEKSIKEQLTKNQDDFDYVEYRIIDKNGKMHWIEDYGHSVHSKTAGDIFYVFVSEATAKVESRLKEKALLLKEKHDKERKLQNIIEEYDKERKLIRQEHLQRLEVIEGLSVNYDSILYADLDANKVLAYRLSTRLEKQFDKKLQEKELKWFVKDYVETWVHPEDRATVAERTAPEYIRNKLSEQNTYYLNYRCIQNGETQYIQLRMVNVGSSEHISQVVMGYRNIDVEVLQEMKQKSLLEEALKNAKLADIAKDTFLSNMSHDLRTPLNAIFGYTTLAKKNIKNRKVVSEYLDKIDVAGKHILDLVDKVLEVSYIESQDFHIDEKPCDVCKIADEIYNFLLPQTQEKKIALSVCCDAVEHPGVYTDKEKLKRILTHISTNAVKFTPNNGKVQLIVEEKKSTSNDFAAFRFILKDNGIGISEQNLQRIFEPFERESNTTNSGLFGSGLGLTIAKHIIEMMGGTIEVESTVGVGSTFTVSLSLRLQEDEGFSSADTKRLLSKLKNKKILLVEDNEINLEIETEMLEDLGLKVEPAVNGKIAVDKVKASRPNDYLFVLMDIQMPIMDGRQATEAIRKLDNPSLANIPIIALSANAFKSDTKLSIESGIDEHLTKPMDIPVLLKAVAKTLKAKNVI